MKKLLLVAGVAILSSTTAFAQSESGKLLMKKSIIGHGASELVYQAKDSNDPMLGARILSKEIMATSREEVMRNFEKVRQNIVSADDFAAIAPYMNAISTSLSQNKVHYWLVKGNKGLLVGEIGYQGLHWYTCVYKTENIIVLSPEKHLM